MRIIEKAGKRGKERLSEQKNEASRINEAPDSSPGTPKVGSMRGQAVI